ncbi:MAG: KUP/HAK/KT family potassium transporter [Saprospiraceae bacterium]
MGRHKHPLSFWGVIITLGIVYGDIGTSPLYVMRAIVGQNEITETVVYGGLSCIFWTLTLQGTIKYIWLALTADNNGEGGIFALYALVRRVSPKSMIYVAMIGCSALLADGIITPAISLSSAVEGLRGIYPDLDHSVILTIVLTILFLLFMFQQFGTNIVGITFGPMMVVWFTTIAIIGLPFIISHPDIVKALNPLYAFYMIKAYPQALTLIGAVFLCVTGAEAMYSDLGHCGKKNIRISWIYVKACLILNYLGQAAWLMEYAGKGNKYLGELIPFYAVMPDWFLMPGIILATMACIIASQALITGSFSLINEAVKLKVWYRIKIDYPSEHRTQLYIPAINWMLFFGCAGVVLYFQESSKMEAAYGLAITLAMLSTTALMLIYWHRLKHKSLALIVIMGIVFLSIESGFMYANLLKLAHGAWVSLVMTLGFFIVMFIHYRASRIRSKAVKYEKIAQYRDIILDMSADETIPEYTPHLVYMVNANRSDEIEYSVLHSILFKELKRAQVYWFVNIHVSDEPYTTDYKVHHLIADKLYRIDFYLGYRMHPSINIMFKQVVEEMELSGEIEIHNPHPSLEKHGLRPSFKFIVIEKVFAFDDTLKSLDKLTVRIYEFMNQFSINAATNYDLNTENLVIEEYPIRVREQKVSKLNRRISQ